MRYNNNKKLQQQSSRMQLSCFIPKYHNYSTSVLDKARVKLNIQNTEKSNANLTEVLCLL